MATENKLDRFGQFITEHLRDKGIAKAERLLNNESKAPALLMLQKELAGLSAAQREIVKQTVILCLDSAIHDFLFALQEQSGTENDIKITIANQDIVPLSDGLHGEAYSQDGWYARFSRYWAGE